MKNVLLLTAIFSLLVLNCRKEQDDIQQIDQTMKVYIDSAGKDMLNTKISGAYSGLNINDINGVTDTAPVSAYSIKKDKDTVAYIEYIAGAKRLLVDSSDVNKKIYESALALNYTTLISTTKTKKTSDTLVLRYTLSPQLFQITSGEYKSYGRTWKFSKLSSQENIFKISK